jgi:hypothetical protein
VDARTRMLPPKGAHMSENQAVALGKRKVLLAAGLAITMGFTGLTVSGASFTDQVTAEANSATAATVDLGFTGSSSTANTVITAQNLVPMTSAEAAARGAGYLATFNIRNSGTATIDWAMKISTAPGLTADQAALASSVVFEPTVRNVTGSPTTLAAFTAQSTPTITGTGLASGASTPVTAKIYLLDTTPSNQQGRSVPFSVQVRAIQAGAPTTARDTAANYATTP